MFKSKRTILYSIYVRPKLKPGENRRDGKVRRWERARGSDGNFVNPLPLDMARRLYQNRMLMMVEMQPDIEFELRALSDEEMREAKERKWKQLQSPS